MMPHAGASAQRDRQEGGASSRLSVGQAELVVKEFTGYEMYSWTKFGYVLLTVLSGGIFWVLIRLLPVWATYLLTSCPLEQADFVHVELMDGRQTVVGIRHVDTQVGDTNNGHRIEKLHVTRLFLKDYVYSTLEGKFVPLPAMPWQLPGQIRTLLHTLHGISQGANWNQFNAEHRLMRRRWVTLYGDKRQLFQFLDLLLSGDKHAAMPLFLIQYVECIYLMCTGYWVFPMILGLISLTANMGILADLSRRHKTMTGLINQRRIVPVVVGGWVRALPSYRLVPGDVVVVQRGKASCDMVLLQGSCLVEESMLSGEAVQVRKCGYVPDAHVDYDPDSYHTCTVYAGTVVQQVWNAADSEDEVLAMVVRTGLNTCMGSMIRQFIAPPYEYVAKDPFVKDVIQLYAYNMVIQFLTLIPYCVKATHFGQSGHSIALRVMDTLVRVAPPGLTTVMLFCVGSSKIRLSKQSINLVVPGSLSLGAATEVVCFDKTGTLTGSVAQFHGVVPVSNGRFGPLQKNTVVWSTRLKQAAAVCHGLTLITKSLVVGDDMERRLFKSVEARFVDRQTIALPRQPHSASGPQITKLRMLRVFEFNSQILKSGVVVSSDDSQSSTGLLFVKGAHTAIKALIPPTALPPDFDEVVDKYSTKSFRVMALAVATLKQVGRLDLPRMSQEQVEAQATGFCLLGVLVITNHLRSTARDTVLQLQQGGGVRTMMITGDYHHTSIAVARDVGILQADAPVMIIDAIKGGPALSEADRPCQVSTSAASLQPLQQSLAGTASQLHKFSPAADQKTCHSRCDRLLQPPPLVPSMLHSLSADQIQGPAQTGTQAQHISQGSSSDLSEDQIQANAVSQHRQSPYQSPVQSSAQTASQTMNVSHVDSPPQTAVQKSPGSRAQFSQLYEASAAMPAPTDRLFPAGSLPSDHSASIADHAARPQLGLMHVCRALSAGAPSVDSQHQDSGDLAQAIGTSSSCHEIDAGRLWFQLGDEGMELECSQAMTALAEGQLPCAVTGDAFQVLLQLPDLSVLEAVMQSAAVFARMRPGQKGQVMSLLNMRGIYQLHEGKQRHIKGLHQSVLFCGDGINDLSALSAADVGYAVGSTEASIAAAVTSPGSISGVCAFIKEGKVAHALLTAMFKYMVSYQFVEAVALSITFFLDGSSFSSLQQGAIDFVAMSMALVISVQLPKTELHRSRPDARVSTLPKLIILSVAGACCAAAQIAIAALLCTRPWYDGGTGTANENPVNSTMWLTAMIQLLAMPVSLMMDVKPFSRSLLRSKPFMFVASLYAVLISMGVLVGPAHRGNIFHLYLFPEAFRLQQMGGLVAAGTAYGVVLGVLKHVLAKHHNGRVAAAFN